MENTVLGVTDGLDTELLLEFVDDKLEVVLTVLTSVMELEDKTDVVLEEPWVEVDVVFVRGGTVVMMITPREAPELTTVLVPGTEPSTKLVAKTGSTVKISVGGFEPLASTVEEPGVGPYTVVRTVATRSVTIIVPFCGIIEVPAEGPIVVEMTVVAEFVTIMVPGTLPRCGMIDVPAIGPSTKEVTVEVRSVTITVPGMLAD